MNPKQLNHCVLPPAVHFMNLRDILSSPVPQMFDEGPNGPVPVCMESVNQSLGQVCKG